MELIKDKEIILVVDDQPNNIKVISSVLSDHYTLSIANSGETALRILDKLTPSLILLDIMMPDIDGYQVCKIIKENSKLRDIPVIFLTAKNDIEDVVKGFEFGAVDYITKPFNTQEVMVRIKNHLNLVNANIKLKRQKEEIEDFLYQLEIAHKELTKRNEDLFFAHSAVEEHAFQVNQMNQKLLESEYKLKNTVASLINLNKEKDRFFSIISHDLKSPFSGFLGLLSLLDKDESKLDDETKRELISTLNQSAKKFYSLLEDLLEWSMLQTKKIRFNPIECMIKDLVDDIILVVDIFASTKQITILNNIPDDIIMNVDMNMMSSVFRNLISNAIKFSHKNSEIKIGVFEKKTDAITFLIEDKGIGIPESIMEKLFKVGENVIQHGTNFEHGTGLGLILCKEYIDMHNGNIWVKSAKGIGSVFYITIPFLNKQ